MRDKKSSNKKDEGHVCKSIQTIACDLFHQLGEGRGKNILLIGESPAANGWNEGKACRAANGKLLATGCRLNELLEPFDISVDTCGFTELSKCCVSDRKDLVECSKKSWPLFVELLNKRQYKLLIILGVHTTKLATLLTGEPLEMGKLSDSMIGGRVYKVLPIYHPSPINPHGRARNKEVFQRTKLAIAELLA